MRIKAHLLVQKGYKLALDASQSLSDALRNAEEYNADYFGDGYLTHPKERAVVTVYFDVPDEVFERQLVQEIEEIKG